MAELNELQTSALQEICSIGAGHAVTALSQLMGRKIMIAVPKAAIMPIKDCSELLGFSDVNMIGIYHKVFGFAKGMVLFMLDESSARSLVDVVMNQPVGTTTLLAEMEESALKEVGTIISAAYLNTLGNLMDVTFIPSVPEMAIDKAKLILGKVSGLFSTDAEIAVAIENKFIESSANIMAHLIFMPDKKVITALLKSLDVADVDGS